MAQAVGVACAGRIVIFLSARMQNKRGLPEFEAVLAGAPTYSDREAHARGCALALVAAA